MKYICEIREITKYIKSIKEMLEKNDHDFPVSLMKRVNPDEYLKKVMSHGKINIAVNDKNQVTSCIFFYSNNLETNTGFITLLCVDKKYRNCGIASRLLSLAFSNMLDSNMKYCELSTNTENSRSINLYRKKGFTEIRREKDEIYFRKKLETNILLTSVGRRGYLVQYFKNALNGNGKVFVLNSDSNSPAFKYADYYGVSPLIYDEGYIDFLLDYCVKYEIKMLVSLFDIDLYVLASNKDKFEKIGVVVAVSDKDFIKICNDKWLTYNYLTENGIPAPKTFLSLADAKKAINDGNIKYPLIVKPRWGMGSLEIFTADNMEELRLFYDKIKRNIEKSYLKYESRQDKDNCVIIQQKIIGEEYGADIINDLKGNHRSTIIRKKIGMRAGETDAAEIIENRTINDITSKLAALTKHIGNLDIDILSNGKDYYILEMNARFGGGYPFSHIAGVNLPLALIKWAINEDVEDNLLKAKIGVKGQKDILIAKIK